MNFERILDELSENGADYCEIRKEKWNKTGLSLKDGKVEKLNVGSEKGAFIRVLYKNGWGCVGTSNLDELREAADRALSLAKDTDAHKEEETGIAGVEINKGSSDIEMKEDFMDIDTGEKIELMKDLEDKLDKDFVSTSEVRYSDSLVDKEIINSEGTHITLKVPRVIAYLIVNGKSDTIQRALESVGGTGGYEIIDGIYDKVDIVLDRLENLLEADTPPSGSMPLIMDPDLNGVFIHEAFGHAAEGDLVSSGNSCLEGKIGDKVAKESITIKDDPTYDAYGRTLYDDEGTKSRNRVLVKEGTLNDFILDRESAWKLDMEPNGGAKAEDFRAKPIVRMTNTIMEPGDMSFEELLEQVDRGVYAKASSGGQVNTGQGTFQFNAQEAHLIEDGEIVKPLRDVSFNGFTLETLQNITGITDEMKMGAGHCGKGQTAPVSHGGPHALVSEVTVGGQE